MSPDSLPVSGCTDVHRLYRGLTAGRGSIPVSRTQANVATEKLPGTLALWCDRDMAVTLVTTETDLAGEAPSL